MPLSEQEFTELVEKGWGRWVGIVASRFDLRVAPAEDIVQCALLKAWNKRHTCLSSPAMADKWIVGCLFLEALMYLRGAKRYRKRLRRARHVKERRASQF